MNRTIFHIDINHCYAQIEEMQHPELRNIPMAVGGHEETRHGIILTKNDEAKKYHIKTGESLRDAKKKCPDLLIIPPSYDKYIYYTDLVKEIYHEYSDHVESFGLDEAWIDYTDSERLFGDPILCAERIQERVEKEIGLTVSVGVSWNKVFAKLGSDMHKPKGFTVITKQNYKDVVWPLPAGDLLYVGPATQKKLYARGILTIGDLAEYPSEYLKKEMGIAGMTIHAFANGNDQSIVQETNWSPAPKSIGNSITMIHDVSSLEELKPVLYMLCESVASRMKEAGMEGDKVSVSMRTAGLDWIGWEHKFERKTNISTEIFHDVMRLMEAYDFSSPLRAIGVTVGNLSFEAGTYQTSLFEDFSKHEKDRNTDIALDIIRERFGFTSIRRACTLSDTGLTDFNVKEEHEGFHPVGYFRGRKMSF